MTSYAELNLCDFKACIFYNKSLMCNGEFFTFSLVIERNVPLPVEAIRDYPKRTLTLDDSSWPSFRKFADCDSNRRVMPSVGN
jgi:hypothetical protein